jgi:hypothetical protein
VEDELTNVEYIASIQTVTGLTCRSCVPTYSLVNKIKLPTHNVETNVCFNLQDLKLSSSVDKTCTDILIST